MDLVTMIVEALKWVIKWPLRVFLFIFALVVTFLLYVMGYIFLLFSRIGKWIIELADWDDW